MPQNRIINSRFHSNVKLPLVMWPPVANHIITSWCLGQSCAYFVFAPFPFFRGSSGNFSSKGFEILPIYTVPLKLLTHYLTPWQCKKGVICFSFVRRSSPGFHYTTGLAWTRNPVFTKRNCSGWCYKKGIQSYGGSLGKKRHKSIKDTGVWNVVRTYFLKKVSGELEHSFKTFSHSIFDTTDTK